VRLSCTPRSGSATVSIKNGLMVALSPTCGGTVAGLLVVVNVRADRLEKALMACRAVAANDARGMVDAVIARYPDLRKSLPTFRSLPFTSDTNPPKH
jgi:hypothetical protein